MLINIRVGYYTYGFLVPSCFVELVLKCQHFIFPTKIFATEKFQISGHCLDMPSSFADLLLAAISSACALYIHFESISENSTLYWFSYRLSLHLQ